VTGLRVDAWKNDSNVNPEELGLYLEGDIMQHTSRSGLTAWTARWPGGVVPFVIGGAFSECSSEFRVGEMNTRVLWGKLGLLLQFILLYLWNDCVINALEWIL